MNKPIKYGLLIIGAILLIALIWLAFETFNGGYGPGTLDKLNRPSIENCESIPSEEYTVLHFNPPGYVISYTRSSCYLQLAQTRLDESLCEKVKEKNSLFYDGSAISPQGCLKDIEYRKIGIIPS